MREHLVMIDTSGYLFLAIVCLGVPYLAFKSSRRVGAGRLPIARKRFFVQTIFAQLYLFGLALLAAWRNWIDLWRLPPNPLRAWALAALFLGVLLAVMRWRWPHRGQESKEKLVRLLPQERGDYPAYFVLCLTAGVCEEAVYRGATTVLLGRLFGFAAGLKPGLPMLIAILIASVVFALAHVIQGRRATMVVFFIALGAHLLVYLTQSLIPAMAIHALYDAIGGTLMRRWYDRELQSAPQQVLFTTTPIR